MIFLVKLEFFIFTLLQIKNYVDSSVSKPVPDNFCYLCQNSPNLTTSSSKKIDTNSFDPGIFGDTCYAEGIYDLFAQEPVPSKVFDSYVSILPPINREECKIEIFDTNDVLEETLILRKNRSGSTTNNVWSLKNLVNKPFNYQIRRNKTMKSK